MTSKSNWDEALSRLAQRLVLLGSTTLVRGQSFGLRLSGIFWEVARQNAPSMRLSSLMLGKGAYTGRFQGASDEFLNCTDSAIR